MMKELRSRGPIIGDALVPVEFFYYTSGIFSDDHAKALEALDIPEDQVKLAENMPISENSLEDYNI